MIMGYSSKNMAALMQSHYFKQHVLTLAKGGEIKAKQNLS
jgi:hypothetical protein